MKTTLLSVMVALGSIAAIPATARDLQGSSPSAAKHVWESKRTEDRKKGSLYALYLRALRDRPKLAGKVVFEFDINAAGTPTACRVKSSELKAPDFERQLCERIATFRFPPQAPATIPSQSTFSRRRKRPPWTQSRELSAPRDSQLARRVVSYKCRRPDRARTHQRSLTKMSTNKIPVALLLLACAGTAHADLTVTTLTEGKASFINLGGESTNQFKGKRERSDQTIMGKAQSLIIDIDNMRFVDIDTKKKSATVTPLASIADELSKVGAGTLQATLTKTAQTKSIAGYPCTVHDLRSRYRSVRRARPAKAWISTWS